MPHRPPPAPPKGTRWPGSGRQKGSPNRISVDVRTLVSELVTNVNYQARLRRDFEQRKVHPTIESMLWAYYLGKPRQDVTVTATLDVTARIDEERRIFAALDVRDLEALAAESQATLDRAKALVAARAALSPPEKDEEGRKDPEILDISAGSDNTCSVNHSEKEDETPGTPTGTDT